MRFARVNNIFISHLHGDHVFGLPGLISTFALLGRTAMLNIYSPEGLEELMTPWLDVFCHQIPFQVRFHVFGTKEAKVIYDDKSVTVSTIPLMHRIPCCGFLFVEKPTSKHLLRDMADFYHVPISWYNRIKGGEDYVLPTGEVINNNRLTIDADPPRRYAYCSDTLYLPRIVDYLRGVDLLYHEATFGDDKIARAKETFHSTASQAAMVARDAGVKRLVIGHFSARYIDEQPLLDEAQAVFPNTLLASEGLCLDV
jgi:ribonuclease Z